MGRRPGSRLHQQVSLQSPRGPDSKQMARSQGGHFRVEKCLEEIFRILQDILSHIHGIHCSNLVPQVLSHFFVVKIFKICLKFPLGVV